MWSQVQVIHGHQSQLRNLVKKNIIVGLHTFFHDGSIATFDIENKEFKYLKFERITGQKGQYHNDLFSWKQYLKHLGYSINQVQNVFICNSLTGVSMQLSDSSNFLKGQNIDLPYQWVDHHSCHHFSTNNKNSLIFDDVGSQHDCLSVFKKNSVKEKLLRFNNQSLGKTLSELWYLRFKESQPKNEDNNKAGHTMALFAYGQDYSNQIERQKLNFTEDNLINFFKKNKNLTHVENYNNYVTSLHYYWFKRLKRILKKHFFQKDSFTGSGGVGENIILNTWLKKEYPNFEPSPHCGDEGTSIGALFYGLRYFYRAPIRLNIKRLHQSDENFGYSKLKTIKEVAKLLHQGKLVMWGQGWGEVGPRALGFRSILMNPCVVNAKEIINDKVKKRVWFRPYGASVPTDTYKTYFDSDYESPWMLYQAKVKDPVKFKNITHADGTCRIQTVDKNHNPTFLRLLKEFEKLSGYPLLINTSLNIPGKPIVGTKKQAKFMFDNSQADVLVIGDRIHTK